MNKNRSAMLSEDIESRQFKPLNNEKLLIMDTIENFAVILKKKKKHIAHVPRNVEM